jgi:predicted metal-binding membrane protein
MSDELPKSFSGHRFMIANWLLGGLVGVSFTAGLLAFDIGRLRTLLLADSNPTVGFALISVAMALTFAGLYTAVTIMLTFAGRKRP